LEQCL